MLFSCGPSTRFRTMVFPYGASRSHLLDTPHSVGLLWTSDQLVAETYNTYKRQTSMPPAGFEPTISAGERPKTYASDRAATGIGLCFVLSLLKCYVLGKMKYLISPLMPNDHYRGRTAPLTSKLCILYICSTNVGTEYLNMVYTLRFFLFKMQFFFS